MDPYPTIKEFNELKEQVKQLSQTLKMYQMLRHPDPITVKYIISEVDRKDLMMEDLIEGMFRRQYLYDRTVNLIEVANLHGYSVVARGPNVHIPYRTAKTILHETAITRTRKFGNAARIELNELIKPYGFYIPKAKMAWLRGWRVFSYSAVEYHKILAENGINIPLEKIQIHFSTGFDTFTSDAISAIKYLAKVGGDVYSRKELYKYRKLENTINSIEKFLHGPDDPEAYDWFCAEIDDFADFRDEIGWRFTKIM